MWITADDQDHSSYASAVDQQRLFAPPERPLAYARARIRAARDAELERQARRPSAPDRVPERTLDDMTRGPVFRDLPPHGTRSRYKSRQPCRCPACKAANTRYIRAYRAAQQPPLQDLGRPVVDTPPLEQYGEP